MMTIFMGKGGVGKTTLAVEYANYLHESSNTCVIGLDQQQNHKAVVEQMEYTVPFEVINNVVTEFIDLVLETTIFGKFKEYVPAVAPDFIAITSLAELYNRIKDKYENIVIDFPPNHAGLGLVNLPNVLRGLSFKALTIKHQIKKMVTGHDEMLDSAEEIDRISLQLQRQFEQARWIPVGIPTELGFVEVEKAIMLLKKANFPIFRIIVNMVQPVPDSECEYCFARYNDNNIWLEKFAELGKKEGIEVIQIPYATDLSEIVMGLEDLNN